MDCFSVHAVQYLSSVDCGTSWSLLISTLINLKGGCLIILLFSFCFVFHLGLYLSFIWNFQQQQQQIPNICVIAFPLEDKCFHFLTRFAIIIWFKYVCFFNASWFDWLIVRWFEDEYIIRGDTHWSRAGKCPGTTDWPD